MFLNLSEHIHALLALQWSCSKILEVAVEPPQTSAQLPDTPCSPVEVQLGKAQCCRTLLKGPSCLVGYAVEFEDVGGSMLLNHPELAHNHPTLLFLPVEVQLGKSNLVQKGSSCLVGSAVRRGGLMHHVTLVEVQLGKAQFSRTSPNSCITA